MNRLGNYLAVIAALTPFIAHGATLDGQVVDLNGKPVANAMVTITGPTGPTALSVYSDLAGHFEFPAKDNDGHGDIKVSLRALNHELVSSKVKRISADRLELSVVAKSVANQANTAPPSAWFAHAGDHESNSTFVLDCIGCHQVPAPMFRHYANTIADMQGSDRKEIARQGWRAMAHYMNYLSAEEFGRGPEAKQPDAINVYSVGNTERVTHYLTQHFQNGMTELSGYSWAAPLAVTANTAIYEYEVPAPNAVREAVLLGSPRQLYVADQASNVLYKIDPTTNRQSKLTVPGAAEIGPHTLHRASDGSLWIAPFVSSVVARLDIQSERWQTWPMKTNEGKATGVHDLSFGADHTLLTDQEGKVWFSDVTNNAVGYFDPATQRSEIYPAPPLPPDRPTNGAMYGLVMSADRNTLWYSQLKGGRFGSFSIEKRKFEESIVLQANSGPRRLTISDKGILYVPLYGRSQLVEYNTNTKKIIGTYDMPDKASAPYAVTWDPVRKVVWIPTSNADAIYRFNPADKSFAVLPMPRTGALMRMVDIDPDTGDLVTTYANLVEQVHGPRMAVIIHLGDEAYKNRPATKLQPTPTHIANAPMTPPASIVTKKAETKDAATLAQTLRCYACHDQVKGLIGPPYQAIAARYDANKDVMVEALARKIIAGGGGAWGVVPMVPNEHVSNDDARILAKWILDQKPKEAKNSLTVGYRRVMRGGQEYFCKRGVATGSRLRSEEICRTLEQLELADENLKDQIRNSQISTDDNRK